MAMGWALALVLVAMVAGVGCAQRSAPTEGADSLPTATASPAAEVAPRLFSAGGPPLKLGEPAPGFRLETLEGAPLSLAGLEGQVVALNFWASWCGPCRQEMPDFQQAWEEHRDQGVVFVGVAVDDTEKDAGDFARQVGVTYPLALDGTGEVAQAYRLEALPSTFIIDQQGNVANVITGLANQGALRIFLRWEVGKGR